MNDLSEYLSEHVLHTSGSWVNNSRHAEKRFITRVTSGVWVEHIIGGRS